MRGQATVANNRRHLVNFGLQKEESGVLETSKHVARNIDLRLVILTCDAMLQLVQILVKLLLTDRHQYRPVVGSSVSKGLGKCITLHWLVQSLAQHVMGVVGCNCQLVQKKPQLKRVQALESCS